MTGPDIASLHRRYVDLAGRFKAAWTFHQFLQGLQKVFTDADLARYPSDFQEIHGSLRDVAANLNNSFAAARSAQQLDQVERQLQQMTNILAAADARIAPSLVRQFFDRVKNFDDQILAQMVRFYLLVSAQEGFASDRLDKVDFLVTRLSEEVHPPTGQMVLRDPTRLRELFQGFWTILVSDELGTGDVEANKTDLAEIRKEAAAVESLADLTDKGIVSRFRELKQMLGRRMFQPDLLVAVAETNLAIKGKVRQFYHLEEQRILTESQRIFQLEGQVPVDIQLDQQLTQFRQAIEQFERKQKRENVKLTELASLKRQVDDLIPRLIRHDARKAPKPQPAPDPAATSAGDAMPTTSPVAHEEPSRPARAREHVESPESEHVRTYIKEIIEALSSADRQATPKQIAVSREVFHLRLEPREVMAYRRLHESEEGDPVLEQFLLEAAAMRLRINQDASAITELLDESSVTRDGPVFVRARVTTKVADAYVQRFGHFIDLAIQESNFGEAQQLQLLRMRLIRDYSGLWLLVNRPPAA